MKISEIIVLANKTFDDTISCFDLEDYSSTKQLFLSEFEKRLLKTETEELFSIEKIASKVSQKYFLVSPSEISKIYAIFLEQGPLPTIKFIKNFTKLDLKSCKEAFEFIRDSFKRLADETN